MPLCPVCNSLWKRRKNGACPGCGAPVSIHDGKWYPTGEGAPSISLLKHWEKRLSRKLGERFRIPRRSPRYMREAKFAQELLDEANGELVVAKRALDLLFYDRAFSWKHFTSLMFMKSDWLAVVVMARATVKADKRAEKAAEEREKKHAHLEDVWNRNSSGN